MNRARSRSLWPLFACGLLVASRPAGAQAPGEPDVVEPVPGETQPTPIPADMPVGEVGLAVPDDAAPVAPGPPILNPGDDPLRRDADAMAVDGGAATLPYGAEPAGKVEGNPSAVVDGAILPVGTNQPTPIDGRITAGALDGLATDAGGFLIIDSFWQHRDGGDEQLTFRPREAEIHLEARWTDIARLHVELNLRLDELERTFRSAGLDRLLADQLLEQAYLEWTPTWAWLPGLTLRAGKMPAPTGNEAYDAADRIELSRAALQVLANPDLVTGISARLDVIDEVSVHLFWFNGWNQTIDGNLGKSFAAGVPHRLFARDDGAYYYEGRLDVVVGKEDRRGDNLRWLIDYGLTLRPATWVTLRGEALGGEEEHQGRSPDTGLTDRDRWALFYGGMGAVQIAGAAFPLRGSLRIDFLHDRDLLLGIATPGGLPANLTTRLGFAINLRYALLRFVEFGIEYRADFLRGDVANVGTRRNFSLFQLDRWFNAQRVTVAVIGKL